MKKIIIILTLAIFGSISLCGISPQANLSNDLYILNEDEINNNVAKNKLVEFYQEINQLKDIEILNTSNDTNTYSGMWIDKNNMPYIGVTSVDSPLIELANQSDIKYEIFNNSYQELLDFKNRVEQEKLPVLSVYILEDENKVVIEIEDINYVLELEEILVKLNKNGVNYEILEGEPNYKMASMPAGSTVAIRTGACKTGFKATYNGVTGFVTAGHCFPLYHEVHFSSYNSGEIVGNVQNRVVNANISVDAEFVSATSSTNLNKFPYNNLASANTYTTIPSSLNLIQGSTVKVRTSAGLQVCTLTATTAGGSFEDGYYSDLIKTNCTATNGDSGSALITSYLGLDLKDKLHAIGIVLGGSSNTTFFVKARNIVNALNLSD